MLSQIVFDPLIFISSQRVNRVVDTKRRAFMHENITIGAHQVAGKKISKVVGLLS